MRTVAVVEAKSQFSALLAAVEAADLRHVGGYALRLRGVSTVRSDAQPAAPRR